MVIGLIAFGVTFGCHNFSYTQPLSSFIPYVNDSLLNLSGLGLHHHPSLRDSSARKAAMVSLSEDNSFPRTRILIGSNSLFSLVKNL